MTKRKVLECRLGGAKTRERETGLWCKLKLWQVFSLILTGYL